MNPPQLISQLAAAQLGDQILVAAQRLHSGLTAAVERLNGHNALIAAGIKTYGASPAVDTGPMSDALAHSASIITQMAAHIAANSVAASPGPYTPPTAPAPTKLTAPAPASAAN